MKKIIQHLRKRWLRYGLETLVVVNGVLIAFGLNRWNEDRKDGIMEHQYIVRLIHDLQSDTAYYANRISRAESAAMHLDSFLIEMYTPLESPEDFKRIIKHSAFGTDDLNLNNSTYQELTSTGNLNILSDQTIKVAVLDYYQLGKELESQIREYNQFSTRILTSSITNVPSFSHLVVRGIQSQLAVELFGNQSSYEFLTVEATATTYRGRNREHLRHFRKLKEAATELIVQLQNYD